MLSRLQSPGTRAFRGVRGQEVRVDSELEFPGASVLQSATGRRCQAVCPGLGKPRAGVLTNSGQEWGSFDKVGFGQEVR